MLTEKTYHFTIAEAVSAKVTDYIQLIKLRLSSLVVISSVLGYLMATIGEINWPKVIFLALGGLLITGAANTINQILEKELDKKMSRTSGRPLASERMTIHEAVVFAILCGSLGAVILWEFLNPLSSILSLISLCLYAFAYTPLKRISPVAVFVGAIPGAMPPLIGWAAATGMIALEGLLLFGIQFIWQFPHFWAIAWVLDEDYKKAGFRLLPSKEGKTRFAAFQTVVYAFMLIPISLLPLYFGMTGWISAAVALICGTLFLLQAVWLLRNCSNKSAMKLMFGSFIYLPIVQLAFVLDKTIF